MTRTTPLAAAPRLERLKPITGEPTQAAILLAQQQSRWPLGRIIGHGQQLAVYRKSAGLQ